MREIRQSLAREADLGFERVFGIPVVFVIALLILTHTALLGWSAYRHSPVNTELGHLPAGISHWKFGRFDLYRVNPPLVRMIAALPALAAHPATDWRHYSGDVEHRREGAVGIAFARANGARTFWLYTLGRWACIPFSWIGAWVCYRWARILYGVPSGMMAMALWCFCPIVLGNGSLMMPDVPAAALCVAACYAFWLWLMKPTVLKTMFAGTVLGFAELSKTTLVILIPLWFFIWIGSRLTEKRRLTSTDWLHEMGMIVAQIVIAVYLVNLGYGFVGSFQRLGDYRFVSHMLTGARADDKDHPVGNRFAGTWVSHVIVPLPKDYVQGIDSQKVEFERGKRSYLRGQWSDRGWWYFYLFALLVKLPLGTLVLTFLAMGATFFRLKHTISWRDEGILLVIPLVILAFVSSQPGFSIHYRYVLPILPFLYIWVSKLAVVRDVDGKVVPAIPFAEQQVRNIEGASRDFVKSCKQLWLQAIVVVTLVSSVVESLRCCPHSLSFFNAIVGGPAHGHENLLDSGIAWGQDLLFLKDWYRSHPDARPLYVAAHCFVDPSQTGMEFDVPPLGPSAPGEFGDDDPQRLGPQPGWYAIDVNFLMGLDSSMQDGNGSVLPAMRRGLSLRYFLRFQPSDRIGYSFSVYHIDVDRANRVRRELGLPEIRSEVDEADRRSK